LSLFRNSNSRHLLAGHVTHPFTRKAITPKNKAVVEAVRNSINTTDAQALTGPKPLDLPLATVSLIMGDPWMVNHKNQNTPQMPETAMTATQVGFAIPIITRAIAFGMDTYHSREMLNDTKAARW
jgi:hypothetical protein